MKVTDRKATHLFLYSEAMGYTISSLQKLQELTNHQIVLVYWDQNRKSDYAQEKIAGITQLPRSSISSIEEIKDIVGDSPISVYCSGWMDKLYLKICKYYKNHNIPVVCGLDNPWQGSLRQWFLLPYGRWMVKNYYTHSFVAGLAQKKFAKMLGFQEKRIATGVYSANIDIFDKANKNFRRENVKNTYKMVYIGRFSAEKGVLELCETFSSIPKQELKNWTLTLIGNGPLKQKLSTYENIILKDFLQPEALAIEMAQYDCICIPSIKEPWGVIVHEAAAAGLPMLISDKVGAKELFFVENKNGVSFDVNKNIDFKEKLMKILSSEPKILQEWSIYSNYLANKYKTEDWVENYLSLIKS